MLRRTHIAIGVFASIFFLPHVNNPLIFVPVVLIASLLPNVDEFLLALSKNHEALKPLTHSFGEHRGIFHSLTFGILFSVFFAFYIPVIAFPFFLGYSLHLLADSWTKGGIRPFWPLQEVAHGRVASGGTLEEIIFFTFVILDLIFLFLLFI